MISDKLAAPDAAGPFDEAAPPDEAAIAPASKPGGLHGDVLSGGVIIAFCALVWFGTTFFAEVPAALTQGMGAAAFPRLVLGVIVAFSLWLAWTAASRPESGREAIEPMVYYTVAAILGVMAVLILTGIYGAILATCIGIGRLWGEKRWLVLAAIGIGMAAVTHLAFVRAFGIGLPRGMLQTWLS